jgi:hypothetical protein
MMEFFSSLNQSRSWMDKEREPYGENFQNQSLSLSQEERRREWITFPASIKSLLKLQFCLNKIALPGR